LAAEDIAVHLLRIGETHGVDHYRGNGNLEAQLLPVMSAAC
jgi:hypothetical protein